MSPYSITYILSSEVFSVNVNKKCSFSAELNVGFWWLTWLLEIIVKLLSFDPVFVFYSILYTASFDNSPYVYWFIITIFRIICYNIGGTIYYRQRSSKMLRDYLNEKN